MEKYVYQQSFYKDLVTFASKYVGANYAKDLVQSAYLCVLERKHSKEIKYPKSYMQTTIRHIFFKEIARSQKERETKEKIFYFLNPHQEFDFNINEILSIIEFNIKKTEIEDLIWEYHLEGYTEKDIAILLDIPQNKVRSLKQRVRRNLKKVVNY